MCMGESGAYVFALPFRVSCKAGAHPGENEAERITAAKKA